MRGSPKSHSMSVFISSHHSSKCLSLHSCAQSMPLGNDSSTILSLYKTSSTIPIFPFNLNCYIIILIIMAYSFSSSVFPLLVYHLFYMCSILVPSSMSHFVSCCTMYNIDSSLCLINSIFLFSLIFSYYSALSLVHTNYTK